MNRALQRYVEAASGLTQLTRQRAESVVKSLVKQGEIAADNREKAIEDLLKRVEQNRKVVMRLVKTETERAIGRLGVARKAEVERLEAKIAKLEAAAGKPAAKKAAAKKATRKATKKSAAAKRTARAKKTAPSEGGGDVE